MTQPADDYGVKLAQEAAQWGEVAESQAASVPPDWRWHRHLRHNVIMHTADIDALLEQIKPGMKTLELGCSSGWLTLAMAQRGADATGMDISDRALAVARAYYEQVRGETTGTVDYVVADLNQLELPANTYDVIAVKGTLHHLINMDALLDTLSRALKPDGLFWIADTDGDEAALPVLIASAFMFLLPTEISYAEKFRGLMRFGLRSPSRIKASMQADGLSPFEGAGREHDWLKLVQQKFAVEQLQRAPAFTGYITAQVRLPDGIAIPLLRVMRVVDLALVRLNILRSTGRVIYARKKP